MKVTAIPQLNINSKNKQYSQKSSFGSAVYLKTPDKNIVAYSEEKLVKLFQDIIPEEAMNKFKQVVNKLKVAAEEDERGADCSLILSNNEGKFVADIGDIDEIGKTEYPVKDLDKLDSHLQYFIKNVGTLKWLGLDGLF